MFDNLTDRLSHTLKAVTGKSRLTEENIQEALRDVRKALLEADVALPVVKEFVEKVKVSAMGQDVLNSLSPGEVFVKVVNDELVELMGAANETLNLAAQPPAVGVLSPERDDQPAGGWSPDALTGEEE